MYQLLEAPSNVVFATHFIGLFQEFDNPLICTAILDLLFVFGSGCTTATITDPNSFVGADTPLCRTSQILICTALAMTRQVIYDMRLNKNVQDRITIDEFQLRMNLVVVNPMRLVSEVL